MTAIISPWKSAMQLPQIISIKETGNPSFKKMVNTPWDTGVKPIENVVINPMSAPPRSARHRFPSPHTSWRSRYKWNRPNWYFRGHFANCSLAYFLLDHSTTIYITYVPDYTHMAGSFVSSYGSPVCTFCHKTIKIYGLYHKHKGWKDWNPAWSIPGI